MRRNYRSFCLHIPVELYTKVKTEIEKQETTMTQWIISAMQEKLQNNEKKEIQKEIEDDKKNKEITQWIMLAIQEKMENDRRKRSEERKDDYEET